jgi:hypothetical protein
MQGYKDIVKILETATGDKTSAVLGFLTNVDLREIASTLVYLAENKRSRELGIRASEAARARVLGVSPQWASIRGDPERYRRKLEYNREYRKRKKKAAAV